jgi:hypothetical protein
MTNDLSAEEVRALLAAASTGTAFGTNASTRVDLKRLR